MSLVLRQQLGSAHLWSQRPNRKPLRELLHPHYYVRDTRHALGMLEEI
jgi:hypothetical protein